MQVEIKPMVLKLKVAVGPNVYDVEQKYGHSRVFVDGQQVGLTVNDPKDKNYMVLHPLSKGYPKEFLQMVVNASKGQLRSSLAGPVPAPEVEETEDDE